MIDWKGLHRLCEHKAKNEGVSFRALSRKLGLVSSGSCFTRMKAGKAIDADAFVAILNWLRISHRSVYQEPK